MKKPDECKGCPLMKNSTGFCGDYYPDEPIMAMVLKMPGKDEVINGEPMTGRAGKFWEKEYLHPLGLRRQDVLIANTIRCFPHGGEFPTGKVRKGALAYCRRWDVLDKFRPDLWIVTFNPAAILRSPQQGKFFTRALEFARDRAREGYRPVILAGEEAKEVYAPWLDGSMKKWERHYWGEI
ncbi:MAG TPA: uracil-DNA glycosylase family protein [Bryobacteraceae bacterium]|nr:uracil-DNA glycosylase family protein [Bryobacteraceae bacterium]